MPILYEWPSQSPLEKKDYEVLWADKLATGETISSSTWVITPSGLTESNASISADGLRTKIYLAGGTHAQRYTVLNRIVTNATPARTFEAAAYLTVEDKA